MGRCEKHSCGAYLAYCHDCSLIFCPKCHSPKRDSVCPKCSKIISAVVTEIHRKLAKHDYSDD